MTRSLTCTRTIIIPLWELWRITYGSWKGLCLPKSTVGKINNPNNNKKNNGFLFFIQKEKDYYPCFASEVHSRSTNPVQKIIDNKIKLFKSTVQSGINRKAENDNFKCTEINHQSLIKYKTPRTPHNGTTQQILSALFKTCWSGKLWTVQYHFPMEPPITIAFIVNQSRPATSIVVKFVATLKLAGTHKPICGKILDW